MRVIHVTAAVVNVKCNCPVNLSGSGPLHHLPGKAGSVDYAECRDWLHVAV